MQETSDSGFILARFTKSYGSGGMDFYLIKTDQNGDTQWEKTYGGSSHDWAESVYQTKINGFIVFGHTVSYGEGNWDYYLVKTDSNGNVEWTKTYGGPNIDWGYSAKQTSDNGYILCGYTDPTGTDVYDYYLIKTDE